MLGKVAKKVLHLDATFSRKVSVAVLPLCVSTFHRQEAGLGATLSEDLTQTQLWTVPNPGILSLGSVMNDLGGQHGRIWNQLTPKQLGTSVRIH